MILLLAASVLAGFIITAICLALVLGKQEDAKSNLLALPRFWATAALGAAACGCIVFSAWALYKGMKNVTYVAFSSFVACIVVTVLSATDKVFDLESLRGESAPKSGGVAWYVYLIIGLLVVAFVFYVRFVRQRAEYKRKQMENLAQAVDHRVRLG